MNARMNECVYENMNECRCGRCQVDVTPCCPLPIPCRTPCADAVHPCICDRVSVFCDPNKYKLKQTERRGGVLVTLRVRVCIDCPTGMFSNGGATDQCYACFGELAKPASSSYNGPGLGCAYTCDPNYFGRQCEPCSQAMARLGAPTVPANLRKRGA